MAVGEEEGVGKQPRFYSVDPGNPINDQMLAMTKEDIRQILDTTIYRLLDQKEAVEAPLSSAMAVLALEYIHSEEYMPRDRMASLLALALITLAEKERDLSDKRINGVYNLCSECQAGLPVDGVPVDWTVTVSRGEISSIGSLRPTTITVHSPGCNKGAMLR